MNSSIINDEIIQKRTVLFDFDGTFSFYDFPHITKAVPEAVRVLKRLQQYNRLILHTMRADKEIPEPAAKAYYQASLATGNHHNHSIPMQSNITYLTDAVDFVKSHGINLYDVNINKMQNSWSTSPKVYAHIYIDDAALGCPLIYDTHIHPRPFVDWLAVEEWCENNHYLPKLIDKKPE
jgi:hypothetical protein